MSYQAIVCKIKNVRKHPNADKLKLATVQGSQIIVGLNQKEDELGVFFLSDGMIMYDHCMKNNLYKKNPETGEPMGGYFGTNGRVKALKLRGEVSEGFWQPLRSFEWTGKIDELVEGYQFDTINGIKICQKYYTPATLRAIGKKNNPKNGKTNVIKVDRSNMHEHYDTRQLRFEINKIPPGSIITVSEKIHGSSGRSGYICSRELKFNPFKLGWNNLSWRFSILTKKLSRKHKSLRFLKNTNLGYFDLKRYEGSKFYEYVSGSRRVVIDPDTEYEGYYNGNHFRTKIHEHIKSTGLQKGEVIFYEIVGHTESGQLLMGSYSVDDKNIRRKYGNQMRFTYGCEPPTCDFYVYRIAHINEDGYEVDLPISSVIARCEQLGHKVVPQLCDPFIYDGDKEGLVSKLRPYTDGPSTLDPTHVREGIVIRVEHPSMWSNLKWKGDTFTILEGIRKQDPDFVDTEEIA